MKMYESVYCKSASLTQGSVLTSAAPPRALATTQLQAIGGKLEHLQAVNNEDSSLKTRGKRGDRADDLNNQMSRNLSKNSVANLMFKKKELCPAWDKR